MVVHAGLEAAAPVGLHRVRGHRDDGQARVPRIGAQAARGRLAVHHGHLHVHEHHVVLGVRHAVQRRLPVGRHVHDEAGAAQQLHGHELVQFVVLHQQHGGAAQLRWRLVVVGPRQVRVGRQPAVGQRLRQGVVEQRRAHRLDQHRLDALLPRGRHDLVAAVGRDHEHLRCLVQAQFVDAPGQLDAVHARHAPVDEQQPVGLAVRRGIPQHIERLRARMGFAGFEAHVAQHFREHGGGRVVVVHDEHAPVAQRGRQGRRVRHALRAFERQHDPEGRAFAHGALGAHLAAHELGQVLGDGQPQAAAAEAPRGGGIGLLEALEEPAHLLGRHADARVTHLEAQQHAPAVALHHPHAHVDLAALGELDRVVGEIDEDLAQPQGIAHEVGRHVGRHVEHQLQPLHAGLVAHHVGHAFQHAVEHEGLFFHDQLAGLDAREIQDVIDHPQQVLAGLLDLGDVVGLARREPRLEREVRHPDDGVHRGADLMAHVGQEVGFERRGFLGQFLGPAQLALGPLAVGDVHQRADGAAGRSVGPLEAVHPEQRVVDLSVGIGEIDLLVDRRPAGADGAGVGLEFGALGLVEEARLVHRLAQEVLPADAEGLLVGPVESPVAPVPVLVEQRNRNGVHQRLLECELVRQAGLQLLLLMHVHLHADEPPRPSLGIPLDARRAQQPALAAVRTHHAPGILQAGGSSCQGGIQARLHARPVLHVQAVHPVNQPQSLGPVRQPVEGPELLAEHQVVARQVEVEDTDAAGLLRQDQALVHLAHGCLGAPRLGDILDHPDAGMRVALQRQQAARKPRLENRAVPAHQPRDLPHGFTGFQPALDARHEAPVELLAAEDGFHPAPLQLPGLHAQQLQAGGVEAQQAVIGHDEHGRGVIEDGRLLRERVIEFALAPLQFLVGRDALGHVLVQAHDRDAPATVVEHRRERRLVVVDRAVLPLVDEFAAPGQARDQPRPHLPVGFGRRLPRGHQRGLAAAHLVQAVARIGLILRIDPVDAALGIGDDHRHGAGLQRRAQHAEAFHRQRHARPVAHHVQQHAAQHHQQREHAHADLPALRRRQQRMQVVEHHQLPRAVRVVPFEIAALHRIANAPHHGLARIRTERQGLRHAVVEQRAELALPPDRVDALLRQRRRDGIAPLRLRGCEGHALRRQQRHRVARALQLGFHRLEGHLHEHHPHDHARGRIALVERRRVVQPAVLRIRAKRGIHVHRAAHRLQEIGPVGQIHPEGRRGWRLVRHHPAAGIQHVHAAQQETAAHHGQTGQRLRRVGRQRAERDGLQRGLAQAQQGHRTQQRAAGGLAHQHLGGMAQQALPLLRAAGLPPFRHGGHRQPGADGGQHQHHGPAPQPLAVTLGHLVEQRGQAAQARTHAHGRSRNANPPNPQRPGGPCRRRCRRGTAGRGGATGTGGVSAGTVALNLRKRQETHHTWMGHAHMEPTVWQKVTKHGFFYTPLSLGGDGGRGADRRHGRRGCAPHRGPRGPARHAWRARPAHGGAGLRARGARAAAPGGTAGRLGGGERCAALHRHRPAHGRAGADRGRGLAAGGRHRRPGRRGDRPLPGRRGGQPRGAAHRHPGAGAVAHRHDGRGDGRPRPDADDVSRRAAGRGQPAGLRGRRRHRGRYRCPAGVQQHDRRTADRAGPAHPHRRRAHRGGRMGPGGGNHRHLRGAAHLGRAPAHHPAAVVHREPVPELDAHQLGHPRHRLPVCRLPHAAGAAAAGTGPHPGHSAGVGPAREGTATHRCDRAHHPDPRAGVGPLLGAGVRPALPRAGSACRIHATRLPGGPAADAGAGVGRQRDDASVPGQRGGRTDGLKAGQNRRASAPSGAASRDQSRASSARAPAAPSTGEASSRNLPSSSVSESGSSGSPLRSGCSQAWSSPPMVSISTRADRRAGKAASIAGSTTAVIRAIIARTSASARRCGV